MSAPISLANLTSLVTFMTYHGGVMKDEYIAQMITRQVQTLPGVSQWFAPPFSGEIWALVARQPGVREVRVERASGQVFLVNLNPAMVELLASSLDILVALSLSFAVARLEAKGATGRRRRRLEESFLSRVADLDPALATPPNRFWAELGKELPGEAWVSAPN